MTRPTRQRPRRAVLLAAALLGLPGEAPATTPLETVRLSPDIAVQIGALTADDEGAFADDLLGTATAIDVGALPQQADLDALTLAPNGDVLLSFDTAIALPGVGLVRPGDVVRYDGSSYSSIFDAAANGVPGAANLDALAAFETTLFLSFDVTVDLGGLVVDDEDLVRFDGTAFGMFFDGSAAGIDTALDLDAAHYIECNDHLLLSFDGSGIGGGAPACNCCSGGNGLGCDCQQCQAVVCGMDAFCCNVSWDTFCNGEAQANCTCCPGQNPGVCGGGGVSFDDEDLLEYDGASWELAYDGTAQAAAWLPADVDAADVTCDPGPGPAPLFGQTIRAQADKVSYGWTAPVDYQAVRGSFTMSAQIEGYLYDLRWFDSGSSFSDATVPAAGTGSWYLVKPGGCLLSSWQSTVGAEPGRDTSLP